MRPCCQSSRVLGNVTTDTLAEVWSGTPLAELRDAVSEGDLSLGCEHCEWGGRSGREGTYATRFDHDRVPEPGAGPTRLELAPSNACNLQCTMCNGDWSSSIRLHREAKPALPRLFGDRQLGEVEALAEDLDEIHLFGGEPLLMPEGLRLLDIAAASGTRCVITTNGSVLTPRIEALLDRPGVDLVVSVDGTSREVYESIRCGASWDRLQEHLDRFAEIAARHGNRVALAHCLMTTNWFEFADHLAWAAGRGLEVYVNDVLSPEELSLHHLTPPELRAVVTSLRRQEALVEGLGEPWSTTWDTALGALEQSLSDGADGDRHQHLGPLSSTTPDATEDPVSGPLVSQLRDRCRTARATASLELDEQLVVRGAQVDGAVDRIDLGEVMGLVGRPSAELHTLLSSAERATARTVLRWDLESACEERRYSQGSIDVAERRSITLDDEGIRLRFEYWLPPSDADEQAAVLPLAQDGEVVVFDLDADGVLTAMEDPEIAHRLGLRTDLGLSCRQPSDILVADRAEPPPAFHAEEVEPGLVAVELRWDDGAALIALAHATSDGTRVRVARPIPGPSAGAGRDSD